jgi:O-antigen/teichoic acid export membrane protein
MYIINLSRRILKPALINKQLILEKARTTGIYLLVPIINFFISIVTSPIFARHLSAEEFGFFGFYNTTSQFINIIFGLSFQTYYMSVYYRETDEQKKKTLATITLFTIIWNILFFPVSYFGFYLYLNVTHSQVPFYPLALLALGAAALSNYKGFVQVNYRLGQKPFLYLIWTAGYRVLVTLVSLYFVLAPNMGLVGRMLGILLVEVLFFGVSIYNLLKGSKLKIDRSIIRPALKNVMPLLPATLLFLPILSYDNIALEKMDNPAEMGMYNIGKNVSIYMYTALFPFFQTFEPNIYKHAIQGNYKALKRIVLFFLLILAGSLLAFWVVSPILMNYLTAGRYTAAIKYSNITAVTFCLMIVFALFDAVIMAWQETKKHLQINFIAVILSLTYYTIAGHYFKQIGIAVATILSYFTLVFLQGLFINSRIKKQAIIAAAEGVNPSAKK